MWRRLSCALAFGGNNAQHMSGNIALLVLRLYIGLTMSIYYGMSKLFPSAEAGEGWSLAGIQIGPRDWFVQDVADLGFPLPLFFAWCATLAEAIGGLLLAAGCVTRPASILIAFTMFVACFVYRPEQSLWEKGIPFMYFVITAFFAVHGAARFSVDAWLRERFINPKRRQDDV